MIISKVPIITRNHWNASLFPSSAICPPKKTLGHPTLPHWHHRQRYSNHHLPPQLVKNPAPHPQANPTRIKPYQRVYSPPWSLNNPLVKDLISDSSQLKVRRHRRPGPHKKVSSWPLLQVLEDKCQCADVLVPPRGSSVIYRWRDEKKTPCSYSKGTNLIFFDRCNTSKMKSLPHNWRLRRNEFEFTYPTKREKDGKGKNHRLKSVPAPGMGYKKTSRKGIGRKNAKLHSLGNEKTYKLHNKSFA